MALLLQDESFITGFFGQFGYLAPFTILLLAGVGLPVPEEVTMIGSGFLLYQGRVEFVPIVLVCMAATLLGDSIPFYLGHRFGMSALRFPWVAKIVHPERFALIEKRFVKHGNWAVFTCRFLPGVRLPGFFSAGTLGMSYPRFILIDAIGATIMVPLFVTLGRLSGEKVARLESRVQNLHQILAFLVLALVLVLLAHMLVLRRDKQVARLEAHKQGRRADDRAEGGSDGDA
ncbi:MAG: DedA family protein [bacterium]|nr:DedA family protein [bacterium]